MTGSSLGALGGKVVLASSSDEAQPPRNIIDGNAETFWLSTGMFPQEFIVRLAETTGIDQVTIDSYNAKRNHCFPSAVHHHLGIRSFCLSAQGQHSDLVFQGPALARCPFPKCIGASSVIFLYLSMAWPSVSHCVKLLRKLLYRQSVWRTSIIHVVCL
uniref:F5/8 type C domain-containing protein n=1 Tax=Gadus morhua TaxID=8049 RepID=A0A8C5D0P1_GADMO